MLRHWAMMIHTAYAVCIIIAQQILIQPQGLFLSIGLYESIMRFVLPPTFNVLL